MSQTVCKAFKTRIYPTKEQIRYFNNAFGITRFVYNWSLNTWNQMYENEEKPSIYTLQKEFVRVRDKQYTFANNVNSRVVRWAIDDLGKAFNSFTKNFNHFNKPKFKSKKKSKPSFSFDRTKIQTKTFSMTLNKIKGQYNRTSIRTSESISFLKNKNITRITISKVADKYYVSFSYKENKKVNNYNHRKEKVGIDLGLKTFATQSDNKISKLPKKVKVLERKIKKQQKTLSKKQYDSKNYLKAKIKLQKLNHTMVNIRNDFLQKYTTYLCKKYKVIIIEDLNISAMLKNKKLAKSVSRSSFYRFRSLLENKSKKYKNELLIADRWFASSKICSRCGFKKNKLKLSERVYICNNCGNKINRDLNAAINLENYK